MIYTVKTLNKTVINKKINDTHRETHITLPFTVKELNYSDNITLLEEGFTKTKAKNAIKEKIEKYLEKLAEYTEFELEV